MVNFVLDIETPQPPSLHGLEHVDVEVLDARASLDTKTSERLGKRVALHHEDTPPQTLVRHDAQEALAQVEETRKVHDAMGVKSCNCTP